MGPGLDRLILTTDPVNRAYGPDGFLRSFDLRPELKFITAPTLILGGRHGGDEPQALLDVIQGFMVYTRP